MPKKKRSTVGDRRKYDYKPKKSKTSTSDSQVESEIEQSALKHVPTCDSESQTFSLQTRDNGIQTKVLETIEIQTQTKETECDHLYAQGYVEPGRTDLDHQLEYMYETVCGHIRENEIEVEVEDVIVTVESQQFETLASDIKECASKRDLSIRETESDITLVKFYLSDPLTVKYTVQFDNYFNCKVFVHRKPIESSHSFWLDLPRIFTSLESVLKLLDKLEEMNVCCGNFDEEFQTLVPIGAVLTSNTDTAVLAYREGDFGAITASGEKYSSTIRSSKCEMITKRKMKCISCANYGYALDKRLKRLQNRETSERKFIHTSFKHKDMTRKELCRKLAEQKEEIDDLQLKVFKLKRKFENAIRENGVCVQEHQHKELNSLMVSCDDEFKKSFPDSNSRQRLFWEQQLLHSSKGDKRGMRWHPMIIRWCLFMRHKSEKAYEALRESGFINLPSSRTLFDYSHFLKSELGFNSDVFKLVANEGEKNGLYKEDWRRNVGLLFDEIKIREDLVYDKHSGELIGYCNLGDIGDQMLAFEAHQSESKQELAKFVLVIMLRSICSKLCFPLCAFATRSITADFLYPILWQTVSIVQTQLKLKVLFFTCDGAAPNRRFLTCIKMELKI